MSKVHMPYPFYKEICLSMAEKLEEFKPTVIVAVMRGGMTAAHIVARHMSLPVGVCYIGAKGVEPNIMLPLSDKPHRVVFVEDLVALGRTYRKLTDYLDRKALYEYEFAPILVDGKSEYNFNFYGIKTDHWVVAPYEESDRMHEGARGLFRDNEDTYR